MATALDQQAPPDHDTDRTRAVARQPPADGLVQHLTQLCAASAQASRVLFDSRLEALAARLDGIDTLQIQPASPDHVTSFDEPGRIVLAHVAGNLTIDFDLRFYPALQILAGSGSADTGAAQSLRQSIATALLAPLTDVLQLAGIGSWRIASVQRVTGVAAAPAAGELVAHVCIGAGGRNYDARVHASPAILGLLERRMASTVYAFAAAVAPPWWVPGRVTIGGRRIAINALEVLRPGDVLLRTMPSATQAALRAGQAFRARAAWGTPGMKQIVAAAQIESNRLAIIEEPTMTDDPQQSDDGDTPLAVNFQDDPIEIGKLDLLVQFELDSVALPLAQLTALRPGYVIELDTPVSDAQIRLVAHGQTIGYGELIAVAEHLGIRIVSMAHGDGPVR
jgi:type III secretion protein Q